MSRKEDMRGKKKQKGEEGSRGGRKIGGGRGGKSREERRWERKVNSLIPRPEEEGDEINSSATRECYLCHNFLLCAILVYNFTECVSWEHAALFPDPTHPPHCLQYVRVWVNFSHVSICSKWQK